MNRINQSMLEYWFANLDKKIDSYDADIVVAETQLRALKSSARNTGEWSHINVN